jgi:hypothetical protein
MLWGSASGTERAACRDLRSGAGWFADVRAPTEHTEIHYTDGQVPLHGWRPDIQDRSPCRGPSPSGIGRSRFGGRFGLGSGAVPDDVDVAVEDVVADGATVRLTESRAQADLLAVLQSCGTGRLRCSDKTRRPSAATVAAVAERLSGGDFYADEAIAAFAWPLLVQAAGLVELRQRAAAVDRPWPCGPEQARRRDDPAGVAGLGDPGGARRAEPGRAHQGAAGDERADLGQDPPAGRRGGAGRLPTRRVDRHRRPVHDYAPGRPVANGRAQRTRPVEAVHHRRAVRQPRLRGVRELAGPGGPLHAGGAVRVRGNARPHRRRLRRPGRRP